MKESTVHFCPFGYLDTESACAVILEAEPCAEPDKFYEIIKEFEDSTGISIAECDPVATVYDHYHQIARSDIERLTGKDICNDKPYYGVNISANYCATSFDGKDEDIQALKDLIDTIPENDRTDAINWLRNTI